MIASLASAGAPADGSSLAAFVDPVVRLRLPLDRAVDDFFLDVGRRLTAAVRVVILRIDGTPPSGPTVAAAALDRWPRRADLTSIATITGDISDDAVSA